MVKVGLQKERRVKVRVRDWYLLGVWIWGGSKVVDMDVNNLKRMKNLT
jgi:hypothetical protein